MIITATATTTTTTIICHCCHHHYPHFFNHHNLNFYHHNLHYSHHSLLYRPLTVFICLHHLLSPTTHLFGSQVMRNEREPTEEKKIIDEIDTAINDIPDPRKLELTDHLLNTLGTEARIFQKIILLTAKTWKKKQ